MIIITGGAGFIGSAMLWELNGKGEEDIIVVDDLGSTTTEKWRNLSGLHFADVIPIELFPDLLERNALEGISAIIHMGANSSTTETDADHLLANNFGYTKFFNVYGPNEYHKGDMSSVVYKAFHQIGEKGSLNLFQSHRPDYRDGEQLRDFVYVRDCTRIMAWMLENPSAAGLFNVGSGSPRSFNDLAAATFLALKRQPVINYMPMPETLRDKYQYYTHADITKLRQAGFSEPLTSIEDGIQEYVQHYLSADNPYFERREIPDNA